MVVSWSIGTSPNKELVHSMLDDAILKLKNNESLIIHSDRGSHYRVQDWIDKVDSRKLVRSMSKTRMFS